MISFATGAALIVATAWAFWRLLPREDRVHRLVASIWGPYVGIGITSGFAIGVVMTIAGAVSAAG